MRLILFLVVVLALVTAAQAKANPGPAPNPGGAAQGTWWPDGVVCTPYGDCRYVAPGCELVRVMDPGTRYVLWCREPKGAA
jgi:hypothetical protein